jgi:hypothetical protein
MSSHRIPSHQDRDISLQHNQHKLLPALVIWKRPLGCALENSSCSEQPGFDSSRGVAPCSYGSLMHSSALENPNSAAQRPFPDAPEARGRHLDSASVNNNRDNLSSSCKLHCNALSHDQSWWLLLQRTPEGFKLLSEDQLFSLARARMQFPRGRRSTPQRPSRDGTASAATSSAASSPARAPNPLAVPVEPPPPQLRAGCAADNITLIPQLVRQHTACGCP